MTSNHNQPPNADQERRDDAYWSALFAEAEARPESTADEPALAWSLLPSAPAPQAAEPPEHTQPHPDNGEAWQRASEVMAADETLQLMVVGHNKGGLLVRWQGLQGFVPASQLVDFPQFHVTSKRLNALAEKQGHRLDLRIIEVNADLNRLVLSERAAQVDADARDDLLARLQPGKRVQGKVTNLTDFGAFVDLGGIEGLIHKSELAWSRVGHPSQVLRPQETVTILILSVEPEQPRIALSLKRLRRNPWQGVEKRYQPGQLVTGEVSNVVNFGAFVQLEEELEGLIHVSELAEGTFLHPRNVVHKGQQVTARVLKVDGRNKRLALSLRRVTQTGNGHQS